MTPTVGIVVPAYRPEVSTLAAYVDALADHVAPETIRIELDDATAETIDTLEDLPAIVNAVERRRGKGAAITAGFEALETDVLAFVDADGSTPASSVATVVAAVDGSYSTEASETSDRVEDRFEREAGEERGGGDDERGERTRRTHLAVGSRRHPDSVVESHQTGRKHLGDGFAWVARHVLDIPLSDFQCGAKAIDREAWQAIREHLCEPGFAWDVELVAFTAALGYRIQEVPVTWVDHPHSTVSPVETGIELVSSLVRTRHRVKRLRGGRVHTVIAKRRPDRVALIDRVASDAVTFTDTDSTSHSHSPSHVHSRSRTRSQSPADLRPGPDSDVTSGTTLGTDSTSNSSAPDE